MDCTRQHVNMSNSIYNGEAIVMFGSPKSNVNRLHGVMDTDILFGCALSSNTMYYYSIQL